MSMPNVVVPLGTNIVGTFYQDRLRDVILFKTLLAYNIFCNLLIFITIISD